MVQFCLLVNLRLLFGVAWPVVLCHQACRHCVVCSFVSLRKAENLSGSFSLDFVQILFMARLGEVIQSRSCRRQVRHSCRLWILLVRLTSRLALGCSFTGARISVAINDLQVPDNKIMAAKFQPEVG